MECGLLCEVAVRAEFPDYPQIEQDYISYLASSKQCETSAPQKSGSYLAQEIQKAREHIKSSLDSANISRSLDTSRIDELEKTVNLLVQRMEALEVHINKLSTLDAHGSAPISSTTAHAAPESHVQAKGDHNEDDDDDIFGSDDEDDPEAERLRAERAAQYAAKKTSKPAVAAKSSIILDVKPWGDDTDLKEMESLVRSIEADGLLWGQSKLVPLAYGIKKLQIACVVEDDKIGTDFLEEAITQFEDHVQSVDIVAFNKI